MICKKCGQEIADDARFCVHCGEQVQPEAVEPVAEEPVAVADVPVEEAKQPVETAVAVAELVPEVETPVETAPVEEAPVSKKKSRLLRTVLFVAIPLVLVVALLLNINPLVGFAVKTFGSGSDYLQYVETQAVQTTSGTVTDLYDQYLEMLTDKEQAASGKVRLVVGDKVMDLAEEMADTELDLEWVNDVSFNMETQMKENLYNVLVELQVGDKKIVGLDGMIDLKDQMIYAALPGLNEDYLEIPMDEMDMDLSDEEIEMMSEMRELVEKAMPSGKQLDQLICKYVEIALDNIEEVEKSSETIEVEDISQKVTVLEFTIDDETVLEMAEDILTEAKEDKEIKKILENFQETAEQYDWYEEDLDLYDEFQDFVDDTLDEIEDAFDEVENEELLTVCDYVDGSNQIVGRKIELDGETVEYVTVKKGTEFATEISVADQLEIVGTGAAKGYKITAEYEVEMENEKLLIVEIKDYDLKAAEKGHLNGTIRVKPTKELWEMMDLETEITDDLSLTDLSLELTISDDEKEGAIGLYIVEGNEKLLGVEIEGKKNSKVNVAVPDDAVDIDDEQEVTQWAEKLDLDAILDKLKDTDIPSDYVDLLETMISGGYADDNYYDDSYGGDMYEDSYGGSFDEPESEFQVGGDLVAGNGAAVERPILVG